MTTPKITLADYHARLEAQGVPRDDMAAVCPSCGTVQSFADLVEAHATAPAERARTEPGRFFGFSCVGRYSDKPARGCDWTLGGFLQIHRLVVIDTDGVEHPAFEPATPEQAQARRLERNPTPTR